MIGSEDTGIGSNETAADVGGTGTGTITSINSADGSVTVTNPSGPAVDLSVAAAAPGTGVPGPTALGSAGVAASFRRSDQTAPAYRSDLPLVTTWFIDPVNGSDSIFNPGTTSATALKTVAQLSLRWWSAEIRANTAVSILGNIPTNDNPSWNTALSGSAVVTFTGSLGPTTGFGGAAIDNTLFAGTVTAFTAASAVMANDDIELNDATIPVSFTASGLLAAGVILRQTVPATTHAYVVKDLTGKTARLTAPMLNAGVAMSAAWANGTAYTAYQMWTFPIMNWGGAASRVALDSLYVNTTGLTIAHPGFGVQMSRCWYANGQLPSQRAQAFTNCLLAPTGTSVNIYNIGRSPVSFIGGGAKGTGNTACSFQGGSFFIQGAMVLQGAYLNCTGGAFLSVETGSHAVHDTTAQMVSANFGGRLAFNFNVAGVGISGKGNTGKIITVNFDGDANLGGAAGGALPPFLATTTTDAAPIAINAQNYTVANLPTAVDAILRSGTIFPQNPSLPVINGVQAVVIGATGPAAIVTPGAPAGWETFYNAAGVLCYRPYWI